MKYPIITLIFCLITLTSMAQTKKRTTTLGGNFGILYNEVDGEENLDFGSHEIRSLSLMLSSTIGYFEADGLELGLSLRMSRTKDELVEDRSNYHYEYFTIIEAAIGPYLKYYMFTSNEKVAFTVKASLLVGTLKEVGGRGRKGSSAQVAISPGFTYFVTNKVGLDLEIQGIGFRATTPFGFNGYEGSGYIFGISSFMPILGFKYYFSK
jgi:outer membrane protein